MPLFGHLESSFLHLAILNGDLNAAADKKSLSLKRDDEKALLSCPGFRRLFQHILEATPAGSQLVLSLEVPFCSLPRWNNNKASAPSARGGNQRINAAT